MVGLHVEDRHLVCTSLRLGELLCYESDNRRLTGTPATFKADCLATTFSLNYLSDRVSDPLMAPECVCIGWRIG